MATRRRDPAPRARDPDGDAAQARLRAYRRGARAERFAALLLQLKGYRILARRFATPVGEIDLIAVRGRRVAFVEVKQRPTVAECEAAITAKGRARVRRAAECWRASQARYQTYDVAFDLVFIVPWALPLHRPDAL